MGNQAITFDGGRDGKTHGQFLLAVKSSGKVGSLTHALVERLPDKADVLQVRRKTPRKSTKWKDELLLLQGHRLSMFRCLKTQAGIGHRFRETGVLDMSDPNLRVAVVSRMDMVVDSQAREAKWEWGIWVNRVGGVLEIRILSDSQDQRDGWVSALRGFETRTAFMTSSFGFDQSEYADGTSRRCASHERSGSKLIKQIGKRFQGKRAEKRRMRKMLKKQAKENVAVVPGNSSQTHSVGALCKGQNHHRIDSQDPSRGEYFQTTEEVLETIEKLTFNEDAPFVILKDQKDLVSRQNELLLSLASKLSATPSAEGEMRQLLQKYGWDMDLVLEKLQGEDSFSSLVREPGRNLISGGMSSTGVEMEEHDDQILESVFQCLVCFEKVPMVQTDALSCGHRFCDECWKNFLESKINTGRGASSAVCMEPKCKCIVPMEMFQKHVKSEDMLERLERVNTATFVDTCPRIRWCPRPGCETAIEFSPSPVAQSEWIRASQTQTQHHNVECACGLLFCFSCGEEAHEPATCEQVVAWEEAKLRAEDAVNIKAAPRELQDQALAKRWVLDNTRPCPKCKAPIQKNSGCNHMTCTGCKHDFCWMCLKPWESHGADTGGFFRCKLFEDDEQSAAAAARELQTSARMEFERLREVAKKEKEEHAEEEATYEKAQAHRRRVKHFLRKFNHHASTVEVDREQVSEDSSNLDGKQKRNWEKDITRKIDQLCEGLHDCFLPDSKLQNNTIRFFRRLLRLVRQCHHALRWAHVVGYFLTDPNTVNDWVLLQTDRGRLIRAEELVASTENKIKKQHRVGIDGEIVASGPHRGLFFASVGRLEQLTERIHGAVEAPLVAFGSARSKSRRMRVSVKSQNDWLLRALTPYKDELMSLAHSAQVQIRSLRNLAAEMNSVMPVLSNPSNPEQVIPNFSLEVQLVKMENDQSAEESGSDSKDCDFHGLTSLNHDWTCDMCGRLNHPETSECIMCASRFTCNMFARTRKALQHQVRQCVSCNAPLTDLAGVKKLKMACRCTRENESGCESCCSTDSMEVIGGIHMQVQLTCPECNRENVEMLHEDSSDTESTTERKEIEREIFADADDVDLDEAMEKPNDDGLIHARCPLGHRCLTTSHDHRAFECDLCQAALVPNKVSVTCMKCDLVACETCLMQMDDAESMALRLAMMKARLKRKLREHGLLAESQDVNLGLESQKGWACASCTFWNESPSSSVCSMCLEDRQETTEERPNGGQATFSLEELRQLVLGGHPIIRAENLPSSNQNNSTSEAKLEPWQCSHCKSWIANDKVSACIVCDTPKEPMNEEPGSENQQQTEGASLPSSPEPIPPSRDTLMSPTSSKVDSSMKTRTVASGRNINILFIPEEEDLPGRLLSACSSSSMDEPTCEDPEQIQRRCITLIKPARRDTLRTLENPLPYRHPVVELWWETNCSRNAPDFEFVVINVYVKSSNGTCHRYQTRQVPNTGAALVSLPDKVAVPDVGKDPFSVWLEICASGFAQPCYENSLQLPYSVKICTPPIRFQL